MKSRYLLAAAAVFLLAALPPLFAERSLEVSVEAGADYAHTKWFGPLPVKLRPQMAIWLEKADGTYVDTLYVTKAGGKGQWKGGASIRRPEALPVWAAKRGLKAKDGLFMPDASTALPDAVAGATPTAGFAKSLALPAGLEPGLYRIRLEANQSFDFNAAYPEKDGNVNGQPSLVWEALIQLGQAEATARLEAAGSGSPTGADGLLSPGTKGLDSALGILGKVEARYRPR
ncbi:MAG TPA: DUF2271 domain-containing protein [Spirochaetia bacterium]|nr:DUF2271 domain-containing protein [Spirochaetia bacterium]